jgi:hypothetical protein
LIFFINILKKYIAIKITALVLSPIEKNTKLENIVNNSFFLVFIIAKKDIAKTALHTVIDIILVNLKL